MRSRIIEAMGDDRVITVETGSDDDRHVYKGVNVTRLNQAGGAEFDDSAVQDLVIAMEVWEDERKWVYPPEKHRYLEARRLTEAAAAMGYKWKAPDFVNWGGDKFPPEKWDHFLLGLLASNIEEVWRRCGGKGKPGGVRWKNEALRWVWGGPVTELMLELCGQLKIKPVPGRSTIRDAMKTFPL
jgi:hypothetical protein